uniref:Uncharacterized protein n=1 Tax=Romanomermis culicivorax TaxID=13658 RepID=A0A915IEW3_ROMCU
MGQLEGYTWLTISLISSNICFRLGQIILPLFFDSLVALIYGFIISAIIGNYIDSREISEEFRKVSVHAFPNVTAQKKHVYYLYLRITKKEDVSKLNTSNGIALLGCAVDGLIAGGIHPNSTLTFFVPPGVLFTSNVLFASLFYNRLFARCSRPIFIAATLSPGIAVCIAYVYIVKNVQECLKVTLLIVVAIIDYQMNLGRLIEGSILTPSDRTFSYSLYSSSYPLFTSTKVASVLKDSGSATATLTRQASQTSLNALSDT